MGTSIRFDAGSLTKVERTPQGGLRVDAGLTRTGVFVYTTAKGTVRELRPADEVFREDSLATLQDAPVTFGHPPEMVTRKNFRKYACGSVAHGTVRPEGNLVVAKLVAQDEDLCSSVERKDTTEVSLGYTCDVEETSGVTESGERYDRIQRNIRYNHVAVLKRGRAGASASLRLDSAGHQIQEQKEESIMEIRIDGELYTLGTEAENKAAAAALSRVVARVDGLAAEIKTLTADRDQTAGKLAAVESTLAQAQAKVQELESPARLDAAIQERLELVAEARKVLGAEEKLDGLSDAEIRAKVIQHAKSEIKLDGLSPDYVLGLYRGIVDAAPVRTEAAKLAESLAPRLDAAPVEKAPEFNPRALLNVGMAFSKK
jgi:hypothetical protein